MHTEEGNGENYFLYRVEESLILFILLNRQQFFHLTRQIEEGNELSSSLLLLYIYSRVLNKVIHTYLYRQNLAIRHFLFPYSSQAISLYLLYIHNVNS
jgi:hypothetical protein